MSAWARMRARKLAAFWIDRCLRRLAPRRGGGVAAPMSEMGMVEMNGDGGI